LETFKEAGIEELSEPKQYFTIREPIWIEEGESSISIFPSEEFRISYTLSYKHSFLKDQYLDIVVTRENFESLVAPSRTFCLDDEVEALRSLGLGKGANYENTLVVGKKGVIRNRMRFDDEFVQHKVLDLIGDLYLLGHPIKGHVVAIKSGHPLNVKLLQKIRRQQEKFHAASIPGVHYEAGAGPFDVEAIKRILPHRFPFLLVDRVLHLEEDKKAVGIKNVTANDYFFMGHFPERAVMPGVLIVEAMAQLAGVLLLNKRENLGKYAFFMAIDKVKFRKPVVPGDQIVFEITIGKTRSRTAQALGKAFVDNKLVTEAELMFSIVEP
jgi:UDP-3-O-[3-hydroxymyristoyl] N-acetylglucosamine deacetylase/3-hydroxyacyl-[acyl-carrier-protein] dehydratase